ncbi:lipopolysaccharide kinase InaA family protein [Catellatospora sichuanensis]|uniref:lipopolysaccharide kinase InaA family protein n=1 Tax=Catellatospora sichuanensis TaxID=1969805 RepID=UPI0011834AA9|nr:molecular chaperone DnaJ [Catellatospora sichuanensis]
MSDFDDAVTRVTAARSPGDLFGDGDSGHAYRTLAKILHPDAAPTGATATATQVFARLAGLWAAHRGGTTMTTRRGTYRIGPPAYAGDIADLYLVDGGAALLKLPRHPADSDLMRREVHALTRLRSHGEARHGAYAPRLIESFTHRDPASGAQRTATILAHQDGFVTLARVKQSYPDGVDPRDAAWMWRRLLVAVGYAHRAGVVHGAVVPDHVLIHPGEHGLVLVDWCYSVTEPGQTVPALATEYRDLYPPEVPGKRPAGEATDIHLATRCMTWLMGDRTPPALARFAHGCTLPNPNARPHDAWRLLAELDELLDTLYGPRTFRPFTL